MLLRDVPKECENTEDLIAKFKEINENGIEDDVQIGSLDVKALHPSFDIDHTIEFVGQEFKRREVQIEGINIKEVTLYIALSKTQEDIDEIGIIEKCLKRKNRRGPQPNITRNGTKEKEDDRYQPWIMPDNSTSHIRIQWQTVSTSIRWRDRVRTYRRSCQDLHALVR